MARSGDDLVEDSESCATARAIIQAI